MNPGKKRPVSARRTRRALLRLGTVLAASAAGFGTPARAVDDAKPTLWLIGDSTVNNGTRGQMGWGKPLAALFDLAKIKVENRARGGRSSRTYFTEGLWDQVLAAIKPGDFLLIQFGHNDGGPLTGGTGRASLKGNGDEVREITHPTTGKPESVHSFGWYLRRYLADARARGATGIVLSPVPRNIWKEGRVARAANDYGKWAAEAAKLAGAPFIDLNELVAKRYEEAGEARVAAEYFGPTDHTHTLAAGADVNAAAVAAGIRALEGCPLRGYLAGPSPNRE